VREIRTGVNFVAAAVVDQVRSQCSTSLSVRVSQVSTCAGRSST
jgi:hypothetical protein